MIKGLFADILGTTKSFFRIGKTGPRLKDVSGDLSVRNSGDTADVEITAKTLNASDDVGLVINSDATGSGADWKATIQRSATGMTGDLTLTLPVGPGSAGQVLSTDGTGVTSWISVATDATWTAETTSIAFGDGSTVPMFTLPANAIIDTVKVIVDTAFDGTPSLTVGVAGDTAKYMGSTDNWLTEVAVFETNPGIPSVGTSQALIASYSAGGATVGSARIVCTYATPL